MRNLNACHRVCINAIRTHTSLVSILAILTRITIAMICNTRTPTIDSYMCSLDHQKTVFKRKSKKFGWFFSKMSRISGEIFNGTEPFARHANRTI